MARIFKTIVLVSFIAMFNMACSDDSSESEQEQIENNPLFGTWRAISITVSEETLTQIASDSENVTITFENGGTYLGSTTSNIFNGRYETLDSTLTLLDFTSTSVADTPFSGVFFNAITAARIQDDTIAQFGFSFDSQNLVLIFGNQGEMIFERQ